MLSYQYHFMTDEELRRLVGDRTFHLESTTSGLISRLTNTVSLNPLEA